MSESITAVDRAGRTLVGTVAPAGEGWRATLAADGAVVYEKLFPTEAAARIALRGSVGARANPPTRRRRPKVRVARRADRPGTWWLFYRTPEGRRVVQRAGTDEKQARALGRLVEAKLLEIASGVAPAASLDAPTFATYATEVIDRREVRMKAASTAIYRSIVTTHLTPRFGSRRIDALTHQDLETLAYDLLRARKAPSTVRRIFVVLSIILTTAERNKLLAQSPMRLFDLRDILKGAAAARDAAGDEPEADGVRCLTPEQLATLLDGARGWPIDCQVLLFLLARTGLRIGEARGLRWGDVDIAERTITVRRTVYDGRISTPKSGKSRRVACSAELCAVLADFQRHRRVVALDDAARAREWVFPDGPRGARPIPYRRIRKLFGALADRLGLRGATLHTLRHTFASHLLAAGKELHFVQTQLGHASPAFTLTIYGHLVPRDRRGEVDFLDGFGARPTFGSTK